MKPGHPMAGFSKKERKEFSENLQRSSWEQSTNQHRDQKDWILQIDADADGEWDKQNSYL
jgi:hypothetical protein